MKVAIYARVSTSDKEQNVETQLLPLRDFCLTQGWEIYREYVDHAPANDLAHRIAWRQLLDDAARRRFSVVLVFKLDRAFRSVKHMHDTLAAWEMVGVSFKSLREQFDTSTALGRLLLPAGSPGGVRAGADPGAGQGRYGPGKASGTSNRASQGNGPERLQETFWRYFGAP